VKGGEGGTGEEVKGGEGGTGKEVEEGTGGGWGGGGR